MSRTLSRRLLRRPLAVTRLEDRATPALFTLTGTTNISGASNNGHAIAADFNADGFDDLVLTNYGTAAPATGGAAAAGQKLTVLLANGAGGFGASNHLTVGSDQYVSFVAVADLTSDGVPDLVCTSTTGTSEAGMLTVFKGLGGGNFTKLNQQAIGGSNAAWVGVGEFTSDKNVDVVVACFGKSDDNGNNVTGNLARVFQGDGAGGLAAISTLTTGIAFIPTTGAVADFDGDGAQDVAFGVPGVPSDSNADQPAGFVQYFAGTGAGTFTAGSTPESGGPLPVNMTAADVSGDGKADLIVANAGNPDSNNFYANFGKGTAVGVLINAGFGQFNVPTVLTAGLNSGSSTAAFAVGVADFDLDGSKDIVAITYGHPLIGSKANLAVYTGNGKGAFTPEANSPYQAGGVTGGQFVALGQFGGSSALDLAAVGDSNKLAVLLNESVAPAVTTTGLVSSPAGTTGYGTGVTFTATVSSAAGTPTGTVTFYDGAAAIGGPFALDAAGQKAFTLGTLGAGKHSVTAKYAGGVGFAASTSADLPHTVTKAITQVTLTAAPTTAQLGDTVTLTASVGTTSPLTPTGFVTFFDGPTALGGPVAVGADGKAVLPVTTLTVGNHVLTASYGGTANYEADTSTVVGVTITPPPPPPPATPTVGIVSLGGASTWGQAVTFTATVGPGTGTGVPTGSVQFEVNGVAGPTFTLSAAGTAAFTTSTLAVGNSQVVAKYLGGPGFDPLDSAPLTQAVGPAGVTVTLTTSAATATVSLPVTLTASVSSAGPGLGGSVTFREGATVLGGPVAVVGGTAVLPLSTLSIGSHAITAEFTPASGNFLPATAGPLTQTVAAGGVLLVLTTSGPALVSQPVTLTATLAETPDLPALAPGGSVTFKLNGSPLGTMPISGGAAVLTTTGIPVGGGTVTAEYAGDANFSSSFSAPLTQTVNKGATTLALFAGGAASVGVPVTFLAAVSETTPLAPDPTGSVVFKLGTQVLATVALSGGSASFTTSTLPAGANSVTAEYVGDASFTGSTSNPVQQTILAAGSSVAVSTSNSPATVTAAVTLSATVSTLSGAPAGSVQFYAGTATIGGPLQLVGGRVSLTTTALPVGTSAITAQFSPSDPAVAGSTSAPLQQEVLRAAPTVTVTADSAPPGQPAAVRAAVATPTGVTAAPTGTITFKLNGQTVATAPLVNGTATASVMLPTGVANLTAEFAGDGNFTTAAATTTTTVTTRPVGLVGYREFGVGAGAGRAADAQFYDPTGAVRYTVSSVFGGTGGVRVTSADFTGDGVADLVMGTGPGSATRVVILDGVTKAQVFTTDPFEASFTGGVYVAAGDITGDGTPELIISPDEGGGPRVRVFNGRGFGDLADFFGIEDANFRGGARAAVGDVDGDGKSEVIVAAGFGGGPRMAIFGGASVADRSTWQRSEFLSAGGTDTRLPRRMMDDFYAFEEGLRNGAFVALGDVDGDGSADVIAGGGPGGGPRVIVTSGAARRSGQSVVISDFFTGDDTNRGGVRVAARDLDGDAKADVVTGNGTGAGSRVGGYSGTSLAAKAPKEVFGFDAFGGFSGGVYVG